MPDEWDTKLEWVESDLRAFKARLNEASDGRYRAYLESVIAFLEQRKSEYETFNAIRR